MPFYRVRARLTTVLHLVRQPPRDLEPAVPTMTSKFYIRSQNDLYQVDQFFRFLSPLGVGGLLLLVVQLLATGACVVGAMLGGPIAWLEGKVLGMGRIGAAMRGASVGSVEEKVLGEGR